MTELAAPMQPWLFGKDEQRRLDLSQFYTPEPTSERMWDWVSRPSLPHRIVCEPSAGTGSLIKPMLKRHIPDQLVAYDVDPRNVEVLRELLTPSAVPAIDVRARDFTADPDPGPFDLIEMNSPYENDQDIEHLDHALNCARQVVGLTRSAIVHCQGRWKKFWKHADIRRRANLIERPEFLGPGAKGAKSDFIVIDVTRRLHSRKQGEVTTLCEEWW